MTLLLLLAALQQPTPAQVLDTWPERPRLAAERLIRQYGPPQEFSAGVMVWHSGLGPFERVAVHRDEVPHNFPAPHTDVMEHVIRYRAPVDKIDDLAAFDGSVVVDRTRGELSARCDSPDLNLLVLNVADEVARGKRTVEEARRFLGDTAAALEAGRRSPYVDRLMFPPQLDAGDPDRAASGVAQQR